MVQSELLEKLDLLPESLQAEVLHYIEFLLEEYAKDPLEVETKIPKKRHGFGSWAGQIVMSDDFDDPLEDLKEYM